MKKAYALILSLALGFAQFVVAQHGGENHAVQTDHAQQGEEGAHHAKKYTPTPDVMHHIADANQFHIIGPYYMPLPCILYSFEAGLSTFMSSAFHHGANAVKGYAMVHDEVVKIKGFDGDASLDELPNPHGHAGHANYAGGEMANGVEVKYIMIGGQKYEIETSSSLMHFTSFIDFSITKNVFGMLLGAFTLMFIMLGVAKRYKQNTLAAPTGFFQRLLEPIFIFLREEVAVPALGDKHQKFMPFLLTIFFFILVNNIFGLIPFFPFSANITGNIGFTLVIAVIVFLVVNLNGNKTYWGHIFWMPDVPVFVKPLLAVIEFAGIFIKPFTLMIRLFANITAGHIIILSLMGLMFVFGNAGESVGGSVVGGLIGGSFVFVMFFLELLVAFLQAFIFTLLAALYIGSAVEEHHGDHSDYDHGY